MASRLRRFGNRDLALKIKRFLTANRTKQDGTVEFRPEQLDAHIHLAHVNKPPRAQLIPRIRLAIRSKGLFTIDAGGHVTPVSRRYRLVRNRFKVENVDGVCSAAD